jgi:hypothetical protein
MAVNFKITVFWDLTPPNVHRRFGEACYLRIMISRKRLP